MGKRVAALSLSSMLMVGGFVAVAPSASAVGKSACNWNAPDKNMKIVGAKGQHLRSGPSSNYSSRGLLYGNVKFRYYCTKTKYNSGKYPWFYGKIGSGSNKGKKGWVYSGTLSTRG